MTPASFTADARTLVVDDVTKRYAGGPVVNERISLTVRPGEIVGLLGPNGAGKTTLVKQIIGLLRPTSGRIRLGPHDLVRDPATARLLCAYLPQGPLPISSFTLLEAAELTGRIRGGDRATLARRSRELMAALELDEWRDTLGVHLSGGVKRLAGFLMASVWPPPLVILDEPTNDVDPLRRRLLWNEIRRLGRTGVAVLLVTHNVLEAEQSVDQLAVIDRGRILAQGTPSSLKARYAGGTDLHVVVNLVPGAEPPASPAFARHHTRLKQRLHLQIDERDAPAALGWARTLVEAGCAEEYALGAATLEDAYIRMMGRADALEPAIH